MPETRDDRIYRRGLRQGRALGRADVRFTEAALGALQEAVRFDVIPALAVFAVDNPPVQELIERLRDMTPQDSPTAEPAETERWSDTVGLPPLG